MAVTIQEPASIPRSSITPESEDRYHVLVYEQAQDDAGIKRLRISDWKEYLGYNSNKINNFESFVGVEPGYPWDSENSIPYNPEDYDHKPTLYDRVENIKDKLGVSYNDGVIAETINAKLNRLEKQINGDPVGTPTTSTAGIQADLNQAITDLHSLEEEVGTASGGSSTLTERIASVETALGNVNETVTSGQTVITEVNDLHTTIYGDSTLPQPTTGLQGDVSTLQSEVSALNTAVGIPYSGGSDSLANRTDALETKVGNETITDGSISANINTIKGDISDIRSSITNLYTYQGDVYEVNGDATRKTTWIKDSDDPSATPIDLSDLKTGWVYNINVGQGNTLKIYTDDSGSFVEYTNGTNISWIKDTTQPNGWGKFDELGSAIDVSEVNSLKTRVTTLENKFKTENATSGWSSSSMSGKSGVYTFSTVIPASGQSGAVLCTFTAAIDNTGAYMGQIVDCSNNFSTYFEYNVSNNIVSKTGVTKVNYIKIGEI